jgi:hypothetical protein
MQDPHVHPLQQSIDELSLLEDLMKSEGFQMLWKRLQDRSDSLAQTILHDEEISAEDREKLRVRRLELLEVLKHPHDLMIGHDRALASSGHSRGDGLSIGLS